jgi:hypothetical protein
VHAVRQQNPCAQKFELQSELAVQAEPVGRLPQLVTVQTLGETQSVVVVAGVQAVLQAPLVPH